MKNSWISASMAITAAFLGASAQARPEYAAKLKASCTSCHTAPWGGGPRTVYGKIFGSHNQGMAATSGSDLYYGDLRTVAFFPLKPSQRTNGVAVMEAAPTVNAPIISNPESSEFRAVATYNFAPLVPGARELYARWRPFAEDNGLVAYVTFGRINSPYGLLTDEHRTYTKLQTNSTLNSFNNGVVLSGNLTETLQYDLALLSDQQSANFNNGGLTWASVFNFRLIPKSLPILLGLSGQYEGMTTQPPPRSAAFYGVLSVDNMTNGTIPLSLSGELNIAKNWNASKVNPGLGAFFVPAAASLFQSAVDQSQSRGFQFMAKYALSDRWVLLYKYDYLAMDVGYLADSFARHGVGFNFYFNSNLMIDTRVEKAIVGRPEIKGSNVFGAEDSFLAMLRLWI